MEPKRLQRMMDKIADALEEKLDSKEATHNDMRTAIDLAKFMEHSGMLSKRSDSLKRLKDLLDSLPQRDEQEITLRLPELPHLKNGTE